MLEAIAPIWKGLTCVVAAPGPSLTEDVAERCKGYRTIAVQDAWRRLPWADILYGCDSAWWNAHKGCADFNGAKWSTHDSGSNDKRQVAELYGVHLVAGKQADGFSLDPAVIHYAGNSGFQALNLAILLGASNIVLVGYDMRHVGGRSHFWGDHPKPLKTRDPSCYIRYFERAAKTVPAGVEIINATPQSALRCFPMVPLVEALDTRQAA